MSGSVTLLICALGGEGGGVLADWITQAATARGLSVSRTSVPGVAQRTGATSYYLEIGGSGVMGLHPVPGRIDVLLATELLEAGRAMLRGFVTPDRTRLIASTHRVYTITERSAPEDGRFDGEKVRAAAKTLPRSALLFDAAALARSVGSRTNAVLLGALAASGALPIPLDAFEAVLKADARGARANLAGFAAGLTARAEGAATAPEQAAPEVPAALETSWRALPAPARTLAAHGVHRLVDYQGLGHARLYLDRLADIAADDADGALTAEVARLLALLMSQEDVIRVAQMKLRPERLAQVRREAGAKPHEPVRIHEFLKPGLAEAVALLPAPLGRRLMAAIARSPRLSAMSFALKVETTSLPGFLMQRLLASLRPLRPYSFIHADREALTLRWLEAVKAARHDPALARQIAETAVIVKGYASTLERTRHAFLRVLDEVAWPAIVGAVDPRHAADAVLQARLAARHDDGGQALSALIATLPRGMESAA